MAVDSGDINIDLAAAGEQQRPESGTHQESQPYAPIQVPTVSEKVEAGEAVEGKRARVPRRILHFSDGTLEEYSTEEEEEDQVDATEQTLLQLRGTNTATLGWLDWGWYWLRLAGYNALSSVDSAGEKLAWTLGITSPKYQYELEEYYEMQRKEKEEQQQRDLEAAGWTPGSAQLNAATNPGAAYQVAHQSPSTPARPDQPAAVTTQAGSGADQSPSKPARPDQSAAVTSDTVSGQPVAADTMP